MLHRIKNLFHSEKKKEDSLTVYDRINDLFDSLNDDIILVQIGSDLTPFGEFICKVIATLRDEIKCECGFILPPVRIRDNEGYQENEYSIDIRGEHAAGGFLIPNEEGIQAEFYETLKTVIYERIDDIFTNEIAEKYINIVQRDNSWLIWNVTNILSVIDIRTILSDIISAGKSINNINYIFEKIGEQILSSGEYRDCSKKYNPHIISKAISKYLYK
jgi:flagellar biosynthesis component FlhA